MPWEPKEPKKIYRNGCGENMQGCQSVREGKQLEKFVSDLGSVFKIKNLKDASMGKFSNPTK